MSGPFRCSSEKALSSTDKNLWMSEEESVRKSLENFLSTRDNTRPRSCSPKIFVSSDDKLPPTSGPENKPTKQIGMDRYITIVKRQRSPKSSQISSMAKLPKQDNNAAPKNQNRFAALQTDDPTPSKKTFKPPPIYLREPTSTSLVKKIITVIGENNFNVTAIKHGSINETKIQVKSEDDYRKLVNDFEKNKRGFYTYQLKSAKGLQVVIKGIDKSVDPEEIKDALKEKGFKIKNITNIKNRDKLPQPMFRVELEPGDIALKKNETHPIYGLKYLLYRRIIVEEPHKRAGPVQCINCQEFGHTKAYCKLPTVCVACGELHGVAQCNKSKTDLSAKKCSNCGANHTANFRGCPVYTHFKHSMVNKSSALRNQRQEPPAISAVNFPQIVQPTSQVSHLNSNKISYANMVKSNTAVMNQEPQTQYSAPNINNLEATLQSLVQTINTFTTTMTTMMQEMLKMQSTILQAILAK